MPPTLRITASYPSVSSFLAMPPTSKQPSRPGFCATGAAVPQGRGGTSLSGQCANVAVVFDYSRYMYALTSIDPAARIAIVQPVIVLDRIRDSAELHHLTLRSRLLLHHSRRAGFLGGMIGNNSCGVHGLLGGKTVDNVESLDIILYDGTRMTVGPTNSLRSSKASSKAAAGSAKFTLTSPPPRSGRPTSSAKNIRAFRAASPATTSTSFCPEGNGFHVARAPVGSEGTCAAIVSARLNLTGEPAFPRPHRSRIPPTPSSPPQTPLLAPSNMDQLAWKASTRCWLTSMRRKAPRRPDEIFRSCLNLEATCSVEMGAWSAEEAQSKAEGLIRASATWPVVPIARLYTSAEAARVWHVRESALGATVFVPGEPEGWEGWEDAGIPPEHIGRYLRQITTLMKEFGYRSPLYGHFGQGCVHLRINFDFRSEKGLRDFREFLERATDLVLSFGGSLSGEHGDGQARAALLPQDVRP